MFTFEKIKKADVPTEEQLLREFATLTEDERHILFSAIKSGLFERIAGLPETEQAAAMNEFATDIKQRIARENAISMLAERDLGEGAAMVNIPPVAGFLCSMGYVPTVVSNPSRPTHKSWVFHEDGVQFYRDAVTAYKICRKSVPPYFLRMLERLEKEQSNIAEGGAAD